MPMPEVAAILTQLNQLNQQLKPSVRKKKNDSRFDETFDDLSILYSEATPEERIDIQIAFEGKEELLNLFVEYFDKLSQQALKASSKGKKEADNLIRKAVAADAIVDGRVETKELHRAQNTLLEAVRQAKFDLEAYARPLEITPSAYVHRARQLHKDYKRGAAIKTLGRALKLKPDYENHEQFVKIASFITGQAPQTAFMTLGDSFLCSKYAEDIDRKANPPEAFTFKEPKRTPIELAKQYMVAYGIWITIGIVLIVIADVFLYQKTSEIFGYVNFGNSSYFVWFFGFLGLGITGWGIHAIVTSRLEYRTKIRTIVYEGPSAVCIGVGFVPAGISMILCCALTAGWIPTPGFLTGILSSGQAFFLSMGMYVVAMIVGSIIDTASEVPQ
jgi:tetratricopeptide (TPR) repeat protein